MAQRIEFVGGDVGPDIRRDEIEHLRSETAGDAASFRISSGVFMVTDMIEVGDFRAA